MRALALRIDVHDVDGRRHTLRVSSLRGYLTLEFKTVRHKSVRSSDRGAIRAKSREVDWHLEAAVEQFLDIGARVVNNRTHRNSFAPENLLISLTKVHQPRAVSWREQSMDRIADLGQVWKQIGYWAMWPKPAGGKCSN
jgi:hypothetical protein